jgi:hypothetical protein
MDTKNLLDVCDSIKARYQIAATTQPPPQDTEQIYCNQDFQQLKIVEDESESNQKLTIN